MERTLRNVLVVSLGFLLLFTAYGGLQSLQSSLYSEEGLGVTVLSTLYGAVLLSSMLLPPLLIRTLGCKWTIVASMSCYVAFSLGNFYASWYTLIPTSILLGLGAAPLWSAQGTYLTLMGNVQAEEAGRVARDVVNRYFGIFFLIFQSSGVWGNLISSLVFGQLPTHEPIPEQQLLSCGARDCLMAKAPTNSTQRVPQKLIYTLLGIYTGSGVLAVLLVALFLEPVRDVPQKSEAEDRSPSFRSTLLSTFKLFGDKRLRFLILLPMYSGFEQAFLAGDYTRGRRGVTGYVPELLVLCWVFLDRRIIEFTVQDLNCQADAVWQTQNNVLYGVLFEKDKEAAFANYRLGEALGFVVAFGYSAFLCVSVKLYILLGVLCLTMAAYGIVEYQESQDLGRPPAGGATRPAEEGETQTKM
ncbi:protein unc-93 homolog A [Pteropus alecto]|uniref:protein unc-93 homolog A n=1 Tax=Pteropus alecto TaxID=9402 RepID=UPI0003F16529|nr:protein unc-93 homolog A [Pteropus alecto]